MGQGLWKATRQASRGTGRGRPATRHASATTTRTGKAGAARTRFSLAPRRCGRSVARGLRCYGGGGSLLQLDGSAPIFSPRSAILFIVSLMKTPGCGGTQSLGTATNRTSTVAPASAARSRPARAGAVST